VIGDQRASARPLSPLLLFVCAGAQVLPAPMMINAERRSPAKLSLFSPSERGPARDERQQKTESGFPGDRKLFVYCPPPPSPRKSFFSPFVIPCG